MIELSSVIHYQAFQESFVDQAVNKNLNYLWTDWQRLTTYLGRPVVTTLEFAHEL